MEILATLLIAVGLAMDSFAVSISGGTTVRHDWLRHALIVGALFGGFQALMPVIGWLGGVGLAMYIAGYGHWIAFLLLALIGGKMIYEGIGNSEEEVRLESPAMTTLLLLAVATSIDALAVGVTFAVLDTSILVPVIVIGLVTFGFSVAGVFIGARFGHIFERRMEIIGGLILIGIGLRILLEHLTS
jgi:manganese efflux pump family protein